MFFASPATTITPAFTSVAMSRSDSRDSTCSSTFYTSYPTSAYAALLSASPPRSSWSPSHPLARSDSNTSTSDSTSQHTSTSMRRDSSNSSWLPSPYRSCMSSFGTEPTSYLSDDDLLFPPESLPVEKIPNPEPKKEMTTEEQIAFLRDVQEKEAAYHPTEQKRKVVRFAGQDVDRKSRRPSTLKRRQTSSRKGLSVLNGPQ